MTPDRGCGCACFLVSANQAALSQLSWHSFVHSSARKNRQNCIAKALHASLLKHSPFWHHDTHLRNMPKCELAHVLFAALGLHLVDEVSAEVLAVVSAVELPLLALLGRGCCCRPKASPGISTKGPSFSSLLLLSRSASSPNILCQRSFVDLCFFPLLIFSGSSSGSGLATMQKWSGGMLVYSWIFACTCPMVMDSSN